MLAKVDSGPIWALIAALLTLAGTMWKQRRDERAAKRLTSGTVQTSEAAVLWQVSQDLRHEMKEQIERLLQELEQWRQRAEQWRTRVIELEDEVEALTNRLHAEEAKHDRRPDPRK